MAKVTRIKSASYPARHIIVEAIYHDGTKDSSLVSFCEFDRVCIEDANLEVPHKETVSITLIEVAK